MQINSICSSDDDWLFIILCTQVFSMFYDTSISFASLASQLECPCKNVLILSTDIIQPKYGHSNSNTPGTLYTDIQADSGMYPFLS